MMKKYNLVLFGVKDTTQKIAEYLVAHDIHIDLIVSIHPSLITQLPIADYVDLAPLAKRIHAEYLCVKDYTLLHEDSFFNNHTFDLGIAYGWQRLIPEKVLHRFTSGVFGFHASPEKLPKGRGHSPMNWSLILGKRKLYHHFFQYAAGADLGKIYSVTPFEITSHDNILTLIYKSLLCAQPEILRLIDDVEKKTLVLTPQSGKGYLFPKRDPNDGWIDFSKQTTQSIVNLIRGTSHPFFGAFCFNAKGSKIILWEASAFDRWIDFSAYSPGTVISDLYKMPIIKTIDGSLIVKDYEGAPLCVGETLSYYKKLS